MKKMNKKGVIVIYVFYVIMAFTILALTAVIAPAGALFTSELIAAGEGILIDANESISGIQNDTIRNRLIASNNAALEAGAQNVEITTSMFQYGWVIMIILVGIMLFLFTRQLIEVQGGGGFV
jgi:hypothetical protein